MRSTYSERAKLGLRKDGMIAQYVARTRDKQDVTTRGRVEKLKKAMVKHSTEQILWCRINVSNPD